MVFSDPLFLFGFLPAFFILYYLIADRFRNLFIALMSLLFYAVGEMRFFWVLLLSIAINYGFGLAIERWGRRDGAHTAAALPLVAGGVLGNLGILVYFKYVGFFTGNVSAFVEMMGLGFVVPVVHHVLPLGVSFFTFQGISYVVDVYRGDVRPTRSLVKFSAYKLLFPQLIAGPIVRYAEVSQDMTSRDVTPSLAMEGVERFVTGLAKKVLLADTFALAADGVFGADPGTLSSSAAWLGAVCYAFQIYFDFSAYSDMAIGLGRMMGFHYPENFHYPYSATSVRDFWRRWHMTLTRWFRDYVYIPLGGNRHGSGRTYANLFIIFLLTGFWHGAEWTFLAWGIWHGLFMVLERRFDPDRWRVPAVLVRLYTLLVVLFGWVLFRSESFGQAFGMVERMLFIDRGAPTRWLSEFFDPVLAIALVFGVVLSVPVYPWIKARLHPRLRPVLGVVVLGALFALAALKSGVGAYSPFLYFRF